MNSEKEGKKIIESLPLNAKVAGFFKVNTIPYGLRADLEKWHSLNSIIQYDGDTLVTRKADCVKVRMPGDNSSVTMYYTEEVFTPFTSLMGYFSTIRVIEVDSETGTEYGKGADVFNDIPNNMRVQGFFKTSELSDKVIKSIKARLERYVGTHNVVSFTLENKDNDVIIYKSGDMLRVSFPMMNENASVHYGTDLWDDFLLLLSVFNIVKELGPDKESEEKKETPVKHISNKELYESMCNIQSYCQTHLHDNCKTCALKTYGSLCFVGACDKPNQWHLIPPHDYNMFE